MDLINLNSFLDFGYFLNYRNNEINIDLMGYDKNRYKACSFDELVKEGIRLWRKAVQAQYSEHEQQVVPLSGGIDSRAILAALLEHTSASNIITYTYGSPGALDYEIGNRVARVTGTRHSKLPLSDYVYNMRDLLDISTRVDQQTLLFLHGPVRAMDSMFGGMNIWSGTIIDVLFGRHAHIQCANEWADAIQNSVKENQYVKSIRLSNVAPSAYSRYIDYDERMRGDLGLEHVIDLMNRQVKFVAPHVLMKGYNYKLMLDPELVRFALSLDQSLLEDQRLYKEMFRRSYPRLFSLPTKSNRGLSLGAARWKIQGKRIRDALSRSLGLHGNLYVNYLDFNKAIRERRDLGDIIKSNVFDLAKRKVIDWISIEDLWKNHISGRNDHADALLVLASLEIHLKTGKTP